MGDPSLAVDDIRCPAELLDRLEDAAREEYGALAVVREEAAFVVKEGLLAAEIILIVDELYLQARCRDGCNLDDEGPVDVADDDVHPGEADDFVQLVLALVDAAVAGHERADLLLLLLDTLWKMAANGCYFRFRKVRGHFGIDEQYSFYGLFHLSAIN